MVAGTLQTDPRSGGIKRSSGVQVLPIVAQSTFWMEQAQSLYGLRIVFNIQAESETTIWRTVVASTLTCVVIVPMLVHCV